MFERLFGDCYYVRDICETHYNDCNVKSASECMLSFVTILQDLLDDLRSIIENLRWLLKKLRLSGLL
jgi:hypothetical protein